jgi:hypothetical protein
VHFTNDNALRLSGDHRKRVKWMVQETDEWNVRHLKYIIANVPDLQVCLSTTWRKIFSDDEFRAMFDELLITPSIITGRIQTKFGSDSHTKPWKIDKYVKDNSLDWSNVAVLDDYNLFESVSLSHAKARLVQTSYMNGLTYSDACAVIKLLNPGWQEPECVF